MLINAQAVVASSPSYTSAGNNVAHANTIHGNLIQSYTVYYQQPTPFTPPQQLRSSLRDFSGRTNEYTQLYEACSHPDSAPIVIITGMGCLGKTELAFQVARDLVTIYPDGQLVVALRGSDANTQRSVVSGLHDALRPFINPLRIR